MLSSDVKNVPGMEEIRFEVWLDLMFDDPTDKGFVKKILRARDPKEKNWRVVEGPENNLRVVFTSAVLAEFPDKLSEAFQVIETIGVPPVAPSIHLFRSCLENGFVSADVAEDNLNFIVTHLYCDLMKIVSRVESPEKFPLSQSFFPARVIKKFRDDYAFCTAVKNRDKIANNRCRPVSFTNFDIEYRVLAGNLDENYISANIELLDILVMLAKGTAAENTKSISVQDIQNYANAFGYKELYFLIKDTKFDRP